MMKPTADEQAAADDLRAFMEQAVERSRAVPHVPLTLEQRVEIEREAAERRAQPVTYVRDVEHMAELVDDGLHRAGIDDRTRS